MKKILGFACALALVCFVMGCGKTEPAKTTPPAKTDAAPAGTSQNESKAPNQSADSQEAPTNVPKQPAEPKADVKVQTPDADVKIDTPTGDVKVETPGADVKVDANKKEAPAPEKVNE